MSILSCDDTLKNRLLPGIWDEIQKSNAEKEEAGIKKTALVIAALYDRNATILTGHDQHHIINGFVKNGLIVHMKIVANVQGVVDAIRDAGPFLEILYFTGHGIDSHYGDDEGAIFLDGGHQHFNSSSVPLDLWREKSSLKYILLQGCCVGNLACALSKKIPKVPVIATYNRATKGYTCISLCPIHNYPEPHIIDWRSKKQEESIFENGSPRESCKFNFNEFCLKEAIFFEERIKAGLRDPRIYSMLAHFYNLGAGVPQDPKLAHSYRELAAGKLEDPYDPNSPYDPHDKTLLGLELSTGQGGCEQSIDQAKKWYLKALEEGDYVANYHLGMLFLDEAGILPEGKEKYDKEKKGMEYLEAATVANVNCARTELAIYRFQILIERFKKEKAAIEVGQDSNKAERLHNIEQTIKYNKSIALSDLEIAIKAGEPDAFYYAGRLHFTGSEPQNYVRSDKEAFEFFRRAAELGSKRVLYFMGVFYKEGYAPCQKSIDEAIKWFTKDAEGYGESESVYELAILYLQKQKQEGSKNLESKGKQVLEWLINAANKGWLSANYLLGLLYSQGEAVYGIERSEDMAKKFFDFVEKNQSESFKEIKKEIEEDLKQAMKEEETAQLNTSTDETTTSDFDTALR
jgi:TPR repeat protein